MYRFNLSKLETPKIIETDEGFLQIKGNILKADSFMDYRSKTGVLREKIPKEILFNEDTKNTFLHRKITLEHPFENGKLTMVNSENVKEFGKGTIIDVFENGDCLGATLQIEDKKTVDFVKDRIDKNESIELSAGYKANVEHLKENEYIQKDIVANHVAVLFGKGRAGSDVKLIYNYSDYKEATMGLKFNGKDVTPEELLSIATEFQLKYNASEKEKEDLEKEKKTLEDEKAATEKEKEDKDKELEEEKKKKKEAEDKLNALEKEIKEKEILEAAKTVLNSVDEKIGIVEIMKKVIQEANPKFNAEDNATVETLEDKFNFAMEVLENVNPVQTRTSTAGSENKFNSGNGLSLNIDNNYFSKKRTGGN
nr:MAG TPA: prohead serine protease [Caudoviricetes sp.]